MSWSSSSETWGSNPQLEDTARQIIMVESRLENRVQVSRLDKFFFTRSFFYNKKASAFFITNCTITGIDKRKKAIDTILISITLNDNWYNSTWGTPSVDASYILLLLQILSLGSETVRASAISRLSVPRETECTQNSQGMI